MFFKFKTTNHSASSDEKPALFSILLVGELLLFLTLRLIGMVQHRIYWSRFPFGFDYVDFHKAAHTFLTGNNPYLDPRFNKPPLVIALNLPLTLFHPDLATFIVFILNLAAITSAILLSKSTFGTENPAKEKVWQLLAVILFSYPAYFVLDRGNLDGFVAFFCFLGFFEWLRKKRHFISGLAFGIAACLKIYPLLLLLPLLIFRQYKIGLGFIAAILGSVMIMPTQWYQFLTFGIPNRITTYFDGFGGNGSLASTFHALFLNELPTKQMNPTLVLLSYFLVFLGLGISAILDFRKKSTVSELEMGIRTALYIPFMISIPSMVYHYEYVFMLPFVFVWQNISSGPMSDKRFLFLLGFSFILTQFPVPEATTYLGSSLHHLWAFPGIGMLFFMLYSLFIKLPNRSAQPQ